MYNGLTTHFAQQLGAKALIRGLRTVADLDKERSNGKTGLAVLKENGYESWLKDMEEEDRLRMCGVLQMIADLAQELEDD